MERQLTVAVTGPTGTVGHGLIPHLEADDRIGRIIGIARRPFDPEALGWTKMTYRQGDVRDAATLRTAFQSADVVVHLAFLITGTGSASAIRSVNIDGTMNAFGAAASCGVKRFVYSSSAAAYGFHRDNPIGITEDWPTRPDHRFFYAEEKAELEQLLAEQAAIHPELALYLLRPPIVLGPHAMGAKDFVPSFLPDSVRAGVRSVASTTMRSARSLPGRVPLAVPAIPLQFIHEDDVATALVSCIVGDGPPGAYNIAGDGVLTAHDVAHELGLLAVPFPVGVAQRLSRLVASAPVPSFLPPILGWAQAMSHPVIIDTNKAKSELGWTPGYTGIEALRATLAGSSR